MKDIYKKNQNLKLQVVKLAGWRNAAEVKPRFYSGMSYIRRQIIFFF